MSEIPTTEEWLWYMTKIAEMAMLTCLNKERTTSTFISNWKPFMNLLLKTEKHELVIYEFDN